MTTEPHFSFASLRIRILLLIAITALPWIWLTLHRIQEDHRLAEAEAMRDALHLAKNAAVTQRQTIKDAHNLLDILSTLPEVRNGARSECVKRLGEIYQHSSAYVNLGVTDADGKILCDARNSLETVFLGDRTWFKQLLRTKTFVVSNYLIGKIARKPIMATALPILDQDGRVRRVVFASLNPDWLAGMLSESHLPEGSAISLLDDRGIVIAHHPADNSSTGKPHRMSKIVRAIMSRQESGAGESTGEEGIQRIYGFTRLEGETDTGQIYLSVTIPGENIMAQSSHAYNRNLVILTILTTAMGIVAWMGTSRLVVRRIRNLITVARRIAAGDFDARTEIALGNTEFDELEQVFNSMAASLKHHVNQTQRVMEVAPEAIVLTDHAATIVMANAQTEKLFGYRRDELIGQKIEILIPEQFRHMHDGQCKGYLKHPSPRPMGTGKDLFARRKDGSVFPADISLGPLETETGIHVVCAVRDITERKEFESTIIHQATHDALTGLPNRVLFRDILVNAMGRAQRTDALLAVMFLDLDGFKNINDTLGHETGDHLLRQVADRLVSSLRKDDVIARQGGDEFTVLLQGIHNVEDVIPVAEKLLAMIAEPYRQDGSDLHVTASIGVTMFPFDDTDPDNLLRNADTAMYQAKERGKDNFQFYTAEMNAMLREHVEIEAGLRNAVPRNELELYYQPQIEISSGRIIAAEALLRWNHPVYGIIPPSRFIPVAEESGQIVAIGEWVLRTACAQNRQWRDRGLPPIRVAVNVSARQFRQPNLLKVVDAALRDAGFALDDGVLELELTESMIMKNVEETTVTLKRLHGMGVRLSIDDFGTGYSSLSYLKRFPIDMLKIDQSFVRDIASDPEDAAIACAIITLAHSLKLEVIAEGVETVDQMTFLRKNHCDQMQGFLFGRPVPAAELEKLLQQDAQLFPHSGDAVSTSD